MSLSLGTASTFAILASTGISNSGTTLITGDVGTFPTTTETGFGTVTITGTNHGGDSITQNAQTDLATTNTAISLMAAMALGATVIGSGGTISSYTPGVYGSSSPIEVSGNLTLNGPGQYVFILGDTLVTDVASQIIVNGGANVNDVYWQVGGIVTLGSSSFFSGNILGNTDINLGFDAQVAGRLLSTAGGVNLKNNSIVETNVCFVKGTKILTTRGNTPIENLKIGDDIVIGGRIGKDYIPLSGKKNETQKVTWVGSYKVNNLNNSTRPICISKGSLGNNADLFVSPNHGILVNGKYVSAKSLINGETIFQDGKFDSVEYYHVQLENHCSIIANGILTESFLDTGYQYMFEDKSSTKNVYRVVNNKAIAT